MGPLDAAFILLFGIGATLNAVIGVAMLARSRHRPEMIVWRKHPLVAPRLAGSMHLGLALTSAALGLRWSVFEERSTGTLVTLLAAIALAVTTAVIAIAWLRRRGRPPQTSV
jgi:hypothetical protein